MLPKKPQLDATFDLSELGNDLHLQHVSREGDVYISRNADNMLWIIDGSTLSVSEVSPILSQWKSRQLIFAEDRLTHITAPGELVAVDPAGGRGWTFRFEAETWFAHSEEDPMERAWFLVVPGGDMLALCIYSTKDLLCVSDSGAFRWSFRMDAHLEMGIPVIGADCIVYVTDYYGWLYAIGEWGELKWRVMIYPEKHWYQEEYSYQASMGLNEVIYQATSAFLIAVSTSGEILWRFPPLAPMNTILYIRFPLQLLDWMAGSTCPLANMRGPALDGMITSIA
ncbi:PQQ-like beta-propeller repeat protein [bacterium]|nr:PQQ-like beta-propeller repeat protein [bacterium]